MTGPHELNRIYCGDARELAEAVPDNSINCIVTSPPYWGLRDYGVPGQVGLEETPELYVENMVDMFRELRRGLRDDGTLWLNLGDSYIANRPGGQPVPTNTRNKHGHYGKMTIPSGLKPKDLAGIPWRVALALQADGWYLRSDIIWSKKNCMPESCTDRPTKSHEYIFLLTKSATYWYDAEAVKEPVNPQSVARMNRGNSDHHKNVNGAPGQVPFTMNQPRLNVKDGGVPVPELSGRNKRTVWEVSTTPFPGAHFAVFPPKLIEPCILAGCPETVCAECGAPWVRVVKSKPSDSHQDGNHWQEGRFSTNHHGPSRPGSFSGGHTQTLGFEPTCTCNAATVPGVVLDPFMGSGTTASVAKKFKRNWLGFELNESYIELAEKRIAETQPMLFVADSTPNGQPDPEQMRMPE